MVVQRIHTQVVRTCIFVLLFNMVMGVGIFS